MSEARPLARIVAERAATHPEASAFLGERSVSWCDYDRSSTRLAALLLGLELERGERLAVWLPDGPGVHVAWLAAEKAGLVAVGIGPRAGDRELAHLLSLSGAAALLTREAHGGRDTAELVTALRREGVPLRHHLVVDGDPVDAPPVRLDGARLELPGPRAEGEPGLAPDELWFLNSTSGTTGLPKCVQHDQRRWLAFHELAVRAGALDERDVFLSALPAPFGFGLWTAHFTPTLLGVPAVLHERFEPDRVLAAIEEHRVTVLAAVTTQFAMLLESDALDRHDLGSLRVMFTGGEAVPEARAAAFEDRTGATVLQFYGSNETGAVSGTRLGDPRERRLCTAGRAIEEMSLRLFDDEGREVQPPGKGRPAVRGPTLSRGYWGDPVANAGLWRDDGWMWLGDRVEVDAEGWLSVVGRIDDFIIRGGKNVAAVAVEEAVASHPSVAFAAAVPVPDPVFGERVCAAVELRPGTGIDLAGLRAHLALRGVSKETWPEHLLVMAELPRNSGGKVAKHAVREEAARRFAPAQEAR